MKDNDQPQQVYDFLKRNINVDYCDDCIGTLAKIDRHHVNTITSTLALFKNEFRRQQGICPGYGGCSRRSKLVTRAVP